MHGEITLEEQAPTIVYVKRVEVRISEIGRELGTAFGQSYGHLGRHRMEPAGPPFVVYPEMPSDERPFAIEICVPVTGELEPPKGWALLELPGGRFATLTHVGSYDTVSTSYELLGSWIESNGLTVAGPPRETYLSPPGTPTAQTQTVIAFPVE